jgi:hypothetical protein
MYRRLQLSLPVAVATSLTAREFAIRRVGGSALKPALSDGVSSSGGGAGSGGDGGGGGAAAASAAAGLVSDAAANAESGGGDAADGIAEGVDGGAEGIDVSGGGVGDLNETHFLLTFTVKNETPGTFCGSVERRPARIAFHSCSGHVMLSSPGKILMFCCLRQDKFVGTVSKLLLLCSLLLATTGQEACVFTAAVGDAALGMISPVAACSLLFLPDWPTR